MNQCDKRHVESERTSRMLTPPWSADGGSVGAWLDEGLKGGNFNDKARWTHRGRKIGRLREPDGTGGGGVCRYPDAHSAVARSPRERESPHRGQGSIR